MFKIVKTINGWFHRYNNGAKSVNISDFEVTIDEVANTFIIVQRNGSNIPLNKLSVNEIEVIDETDGSLVETFTNVIDLKARLEVLGYTAYLGAGNADSITGLIQEGTNVIITGSGTLAEPYIISASGGSGGGVDSVNGQTGVVVLDADDISDTSTTKKFVTSAEKTAITHSNRSILDAITESFTTALKTTYDDAVSWITTNGTNILNHIASTSNPHSVTKSQVGLSNVDNTTDLNKPISTATQTALNNKVDKTSWVDISLTSTIVGFSSFTQRSIWYKIIDNYIFIDFYIEGTSNATTFSFTSIFDNKNGFSGFGRCGYNVNSGIISNQPARILISNNLNVVNITQNFNGNAYSSSGTKACAGQISFKIN